MPSPRPYAELGDWCEVPYENGIYFLQGQGVSGWSDYISEEKEQLVCF